MTHLFSASTSLSLLVIAVFVGCSGASQDEGPSGSLNLQLELANGERIDEVIYQITGGEMDPMGGVIDTSAPGATASVEVFGLPPADDYVVELRGVTENGFVCRGSAPFSVTAGVSTPVAVMLGCKGPPRLGGVRVNGKFNICAELTKAVVSPLETSLGSIISLSAQAADSDGGTIAFAWSSSAGPVADPESPETTLTCQTLGEQFVRIDVSDDAFGHCVDGWVVQVRCVSSGGGAGGGGGAPGGSGGTAGSGGDTGTGGSGGTAGAGGSAGGGGTGGVRTCDRSSLPANVPTATGRLLCDALGVIEIPFEVRLASEPIGPAGSGTYYAAQAQLIMDEDTVGDVGALVQQAVLGEVSALVDNQDIVRLPLSARAPCTVDFRDDPDDNGRPGPITVTTRPDAAPFYSVDGRVVIEITEATFAITQPVPLTLTTIGNDAPCVWESVPRLVFDAGAGGSGGFSGSGGTPGSGGSPGTGGVGGSNPMCVDLGVQCMNGDIGPITEDPACVLLEPPALPGVCSGLESVVNPPTCTLTGNRTRHAVQNLSTARDCNQGFDLDGCNGTACIAGGLAPGEGVNGVDNAVSGLAPVLTGVGGDLAGLDQAYYNGICDGSIDWQFEIDTNAAQGCATVFPIYNGLMRNGIPMNFSETGCLSGRLGNVPLPFPGVPNGELKQSVIRGALAPTEGLNLSMGALVEGDGAVGAAEAILPGAGALVAQTFDIRSDLRQDVGMPCDALSLTVDVGAASVTDPGPGPEPGEGACTNEYDASVFGALTYTDSRGNNTVGTDSASAIASDCVFGSSVSVPPNPGCGILAGNVLACAISPAGCPPETIAALGVCVETCAQDLISNIAGDPLSMECAGCYRQAVTCSAEQCATAGCANPTSPSCIQCRCDEGCTPGFDVCSGVPPNGACN